MKKVRVLLLGLLLFSAQSMAEVYLSPQDFLQQTFAPKNVPKSQVVWLSGALATEVRDILGHRYKKARVRYWKDDQRSAWILDEVGKEKPITTGVVVKDQRIERLQVLVFRESRGWEVRHSFFTDQFKGRVLSAEKRLDQAVDNISGATLSVRAVSKLARLALLLDKKVDP
ncbi:MAG: FMN-binding protein [Gammaproteobacteria bacterium]|nr:FMN-binding protein [Gammaproteobacteria bacterium]